MFVQQQAFTQRAEHCAYISYAIHLKDKLCQKLDEHSCLMIQNCILAFYNLSGSDYYFMTFGWYNDTLYCISKLK